MKVLVCMLDVTMIRCPDKHVHIVPVVPVANCTPLSTYFSRLHYVVAAYVIVGFAEDKIAHLFLSSLKQ